MAGNGTLQCSKNVIFRRKLLCLECRDGCWPNHPARRVTWQYISTSCPEGTHCLQAGPLGHPHLCTAAFQLVFVWLVPIIQNYSSLLSYRIIISIQLATACHPSQIYFHLTKALIMPFCCIKILGVFPLQLEQNPTPCHSLYGLRCSGPALPFHVPLILSSLVGPGHTPCFFSNTLNSFSFSFAVTWFFSSCSAHLKSQTGPFLPFILHSFLFTHIGFTFITSSFLFLFPKVLQSEILPQVYLLILLSDFLHQNVSPICAGPSLPILTIFLVYRMVSTQ